MSELTLEEQVRFIGYELACREIYGENTPSYHKQQRYHNYLLSKLYRLQKIVE
jgi:hypothetical protein